MKKLKVLVSLHTAHNDFQLAQASSAEETARKLGIDVEVLFADNDAVNQSSQVLNAIQKSPELRPDAVVLEPVSGTALPQVARAACAADIGWVVLNRRPDYIAELRKAAKMPVCAISSDHLEIGRIQGKQFAAILPKGGAILYIEGPSQSSSAQSRRQGMLETKPANIQVSTLKGLWTEDSASRAVDSWLKLSTSKGAAFDLVAAQDDSMALGARRAFEKIANNEERTRWLHLPFTGCDGLRETGQKWVQDGWLTATVVIPPLTGRALEILSAALTSRSQPAEHVLTNSHSFPALQNLSPRSH
jgi:ribose transport system substrate-binding protein